jgi:hypothetical protein
MHAQHRQHAQHVTQEHFHVRTVGLAQAGFGGLVGVVQRHALGGAGQGDEARLQKLHMRLVELPARGGGEANGAGPEILLRIVTLQPGTDGVTLAHVEHVALTIRARPQQQVHPGLRQLGPRLDLWQQRAREHQRLADPVGFLNDAQAVGVAVGDEDAEGEWRAHRGITSKVRP